MRRPDGEYCQELDNKNWIIGEGEVMEVVTINFKVLKSTKT